MKNYSYQIKWFNKQELTEIITILKNLGYLRSTHVKEYQELNNIINFYYEMKYFYIITNDIDEEFTGSVSFVAYRGELISLDKFREIYNNKNKTMNTQKFQISFENIPAQLLPEAHRIVQNKLFELGYKWQFDEKNIASESIKKSYLQLNYNNSGFITYSYEDMKNNVEITFTAFGEWNKWVAFASQNKTIKIELNKDYTAEVSKNGIKVGCQTFPLEVAQKLADAVKEVNKN